MTGTVRVPSMSKTTPLRRDLEVTEVVEGRVDMDGNDLEGRRKKERGLEVKKGGSGISRWSFWPPECGFCLAYVCDLYR